VNLKSYLYAAVLTGLSTMAQAAETGTLTLACKGTTVGGYEGAKPDPLSMGLIFNFTAGTVRGFDAPGGLLAELPVKITGINEVTVAFGGNDTPLVGQQRSMSGTIDRVTGEVEATETLMDTKAGKTFSSTSYSLKCRPAQRMF
jgi:hypothetical protein